MRSNISLRAVLVLAAVAILGLAASPAGAATLTWDANGTGAGQADGGGAWIGTGTNLWWTGTANQDWASGSDANFGNGGAGGAVTLASPTVVGLLTFNSFTGTYTLGTAGQTITLNTGITKNSGSGAATIISPVTLGAAQSWTNKSTRLLTVGTGAVDNGGNLLTVGGTGNTTVTSAIGGAGGLTKTGTGTILALSGVNTYSGPTTITDGLLIANSSAALGDGSATNTLIFGGGTMSGLQASGSITSPSTRSVTLNNTGVIITNYDVSIAGDISGASGLTQNGSFGTLTLSGNNTYAGTTSIGGGSHRTNPGGVLVLNSANALPGGIGATGGTSALNFVNGVIGLGNGDFYRPLAAGIAGVTFQSNGTGGGWAAYGADRVVNIGGDLRSITWATATTGFAGRVLRLGFHSATNTVDFQNPIDMTNAARTVQVDDGAADVDGKLSGNITGIAGGGLIKTGLGTLVLSGTNNYADTTTVSAGTLRVNGNNTGAGAVTVSAGGALGGIGAVTGAVTAAAGGSIKLFDGAVGTLTLGSSLTLNGTAAIESCKSNVHTLRLPIL
jgi:autotransporter-associated beta strand protein